MMKFGNDAINHTAEGMKVPDSSDFCQNFLRFILLIISLLLGT